MLYTQIDVMQLNQDVKMTHLFSAWTDMTGEHP